MRKKIKNSLAAVSRIQEKEKTGEGRKSPCPGL
jgi:hypothetical protein